MTTVPVSSRLISNQRSLIDKLGGIDQALRVISVETIALAATNPDGAIVLNRLNPVTRLSFSNRDYYRIYDLDYTLQYEVKNHRGFYGLEVIDRVYLSSLKQGSIFYLNYELDPARYFEAIADLDKFVLGVYV